MFRLWLKAVGRGLDRRELAIRGCTTNELRLCLEQPTDRHEEEQTVVFQEYIAPRLLLFFLRQFLFLFFDHIQFAMPWLSQYNMVKALALCHIFLPSLFASSPPHPLHISRTPSLSIDLFLIIVFDDQKP
jgi:hypothetical protein